MTSISVIITHRNDQRRLADTLGSLWTTASGQIDLEVIVIDDCSDNGERIDTVLFNGHTSLILNEQWMGVAASRMVGARHAGNSILLFTDCHMEFPDNWDLEVVSSCWGNELYCSTYISDVPFPGHWFNGPAIGGANLTHYVAGPGKFSLSALTPRHPWPEATVPYEIPGVIGACYYMFAASFNRVGGFEGLLGYGGDEQLLSWKTWMAGGKVFCNPQLRVKHLNSGPVVAHDYALSLTNLCYVIRTTWPKDDWQRLKSLLPYWAMPYAEMADDRSLSYFIIERSADEVAERFGLQSVAQALSLAEDNFKHASS
jgi:glycosyltransferase involved in cell wall biosynthesis